MPLQKRKKPRTITLTLPDLERPYLILEGQKYLLRNLSNDGIGVWISQPLSFELTRGTKLKGDIIIDKNIYSVSLELVHGSRNFWGLRILNKAPELSAIFHRILEPAREAYQLQTHFESGNLDPAMGLHRLWHFTPSGTELCVWYNVQHSLVLELQLCWSGQWIYRQQLKPARTGILRDFPRKIPGGHVTPDELLITHSEADENILTQASQFLSALPPPLPGTRLWQFLVSGEQVYLGQDIFISAQVA